MLPQVSSDKIAYVGVFELQDADVLPIKFNSINTANFADHLSELPQKAYYNNLYWLDYFPANQIIICLPTGCSPLDTFQDYEELNDIYLNGEIVSNILFATNIYNED
jgi:hypothetical protein